MHVVQGRAFILCIVKLSFDFLFRKYKSLPEVKQREILQKRSEEYRLNRLRAKVFNKVRLGPVLLNKIFSKMRL